MLRLNKTLALIFVFGWIACSGDHSNDEAEINQLMDKWHLAAAQADEDAFFSFMTEDCIYLGTDKTEKWKRDELREWSAEYFDRETAWAFTPLERSIYFNDNTAWFDEKLDTWMGECRGSGVLIKTIEGWKLNHYNLAVTVPNEKIQDFISIVGD